MEETPKQQKQAGLDIFSILRTILHNWMLVAMAALTAGMLTFALVTESYSPVYTSRTTFVVTGARGATSVYSNLSTAMEVSGVFGNLFNDPVVQNKMKELGGLTDFDGSIHAETVPETNLLVLSVTAASPESSYKMSRAVADHHSEVTGAVIRNAVLEILEDPRMPMRPDTGMNRPAKVKRSVLLGAAAAAAALALYAYFLDTVKNTDDATKRLDMPLLSTLYHEQKYKTIGQAVRHKKKGILITDASTSFGYTEAIKQLRTRVTYRMHPKNQQVLMVTSLMENEGKSTVAANLALALAEDGKKVLLVDGDLRKPSVGKLFSLGDTDGRLMAAMGGRENLSPETLPQGEYGLYLLCETTSVGEEGVRRATGRPMHELLRKARAQFDYIIVDTPPMSVAADAEGIASMADAVLLVVRQNDATASALNEAGDVLRASNHAFLGYVFNNVYVGLEMPQGNRYGRSYYGGYSHYGHYGKYGKYGGYGKYEYGQTTKEE